jgi:serine O-acetyltransferase
VEDKRLPVIDLEHGRLPDPVNEAIGLVLEKQDKLEKRISQLEELLRADSIPSESKSRSQIIQKGSNG